MMDQYVSNFTAQLSKAIEIGNSALLSSTERTYNSVVISGLGGSGIGASLVQSLVRSTCSIPLLVNKTYDLPHCVSKDSLVIISSYSGNTEETLTAYKRAHELGASIVAISSNGAIAECCQADGHELIKIDKGFPPRAALAYSLTQLLAILFKKRLINNNPLKDIKATISLLDQESSNIKFTAKEIATNLNGKTPVLYSEDTFESILVRFRQQLNENAKILCWHHVIPEMNHNELVGWRDERSDLVTVWLRSNLEFNRNSDRIELNKSIIGKYCKNEIEVWAKGESHIQQALYFIHLTDWISVYLSELRKVDNIEVEVIDYLKGELAKKSF